VTQTIGALLAALPARLPGDTPELDTQGLLAKVTGKPRTWALAHPEAYLTRERAAALEAWVKRLESGEPLPYLLGEWEFFGLAFEVTPDVLIPRPETELLVERALARLGHLPGDTLHVADVGTGSGCIAVSIAVNSPRVRVTGTDISPAALNVARRNAARHGVEERIEFVQCNLLFDHEPRTMDHDKSSVVHRPSSFDLIAANLPYIPTRALHELPVYGREPTLALDGGADGLSAIRQLIAQSPQRLTPGGMLLMEIEASQGAAVLSLACDAFSEAEVHLHKDMAGRDRLLEVRI